MNPVFGTLRGIKGRQDVGGGKGGGEGKRLFLTRELLSDIDRPGGSQPRAYQFQELQIVRGGGEREKHRDPERPVVPIIRRGKQGRKGASILFRGPGGIWG